MVMALTVEIKSKAKARPNNPPANSPNTVRAAIAPTSTSPVIESIGVVYRKTKFSPKYKRVTIEVPDIKVFKYHKAQYAQARDRKI